MKKISTIDSVIDFPIRFTLENQTQNLLLEFIQKPFLSKKQMNWQINDSKIKSLI